VPIAAAHPIGDQQTLLVANALASARALMTGRRADEIRAELAVQGCQVRTWMRRSRRANVPATAHRRCC
jgi:hypothetical protein